ncbi:hypothetical protein KXD40_000611 [Peronospora effusa]|uniref:GOLD domain-containing protein n=1 Tax=Peronospora effusa TaxID=542832 RepID=A0A3M6VM48_9STRA|nr:hypothetical protein DD238_000484 [Peronospora effusa]RQM17688.1 hypothetical protein DD237_000677 [Peronospora effusa]UIZ21361.1 hypothetical protein KXD40_000611 [Peronospora effusa]
MKGRPAVLLLLLCVYSMTDALYFHVLPKDDRCFLVDVPAETTIRAEYESPDTTDVMKTILAFYAPDLSERKDQNTLVKKKSTSQKGSMSFTAQQNGIHSVCVSLDTSNYALPKDALMRFTLKLVMGTSHEEYQNLAKKNQVDDLHLDIMKLRDRMTAIQRNQDYAQNKSLTLQSSIESNNQRATWVSLLQVKLHLDLSFASHSVDHSHIAILLVASFYQARYLQAYFHKKKLV